MLASARFCSACGDFLSPQNDHPTFLIASSDELATFVSDAAERDISIMPANNVNIVAKALDYKTSAMSTGNETVASDISEYDTNMLRNNSTKAASDSINYKTSAMPDENATIEAGDVSYRTSAISDENATIEAGDVNYQTSAIPDGNATLEGDIASYRTGLMPDVIADKDAINIARQKKESVQTYNYEGFAESDDVTHPLTDFAPHGGDANYDTYAARGAYGQGEPAVVTEPPAGWLKKDGDESALTVPGLFAQLKPASNPSLKPVGSPLPVAASNLPRAERRQPEPVPYVKKAYAPPFRPAAINSRAIAPGASKPFYKRYIFLATAILLLVSFITLTMTYAYLTRARSAPALPPTLAANTTNAFPGGSITIQGSHFIPGGTVTIKADGVLLAHNTSPTTAGLGMVLALYNSSQSTSQAPIVQADGSFETTVTVPKDWSAGNHEISAEEQADGKTVSTKINVVINAQTPVVPTPTPQTTAYPTPQATAHPAPTPQVTIYPTPKPLPTPAYVAPCLSVSNNTLNFNATVGGNSPAPQTITLMNKCGAGTWSARSDATWLTANTPANGSAIAAHGTVNVSISAANGTLAAKSYTGHIVFSAGSSQATVTVTQTITQSITACIKVDPASLSFSGTSAQEPAAQTILVTNCGSAGTVAVTVSTSSTSHGLASTNGSQTYNGAGWLTASPGGPLAEAGTLSISVTANRAATNLSAGVYTSSITITMKTKDGKTDTHMVNVTFAVHSAA